MIYSLHVYCFRLRCSYFGFAVFWSIFEAARESHIARFIYAAIFYGIALAIAGLAFRRGFDEFYAM